MHTMKHTITRIAIIVIGALPHCYIGYKRETCSYYIIIIYFFSLKLKCLCAFLDFYVKILWKNPVVL